MTKKPDDQNLKRVQVLIDMQDYEKLKENIRKTGFSSISSLLRYLLRQFMDKNKI